jgi:DNA-binding response OmpR family regulator
MNLSHSINSLKVLYIGHDARLMQGLLNLTQANAQVELKIAPSVQNGLIQLANFQPQLLLLDEHLPEIDTLSVEMAQPNLTIHILRESSLDQLNQLILAQLSPQTILPQERV